MSRSAITAGSVIDIPARPGIVIGEDPGTVPASGTRPGLRRFPLEFRLDARDWASGLRNISPTFTRQVLCLTPTGVRSPFAIRRLRDCTGSGSVDVPGVRFGSVSSRTISQAVKAFAVSDPEAGEEAQSAVGWIVGGEDVDDPAAVTLAGVQRFVWYELAVKWMMPDEDKPIIVDALARLLDILDRPACAEVCRSPLTTKVLAAWARSDDEGRKAIAQAIKTSLVEPVDTDRFGWGSIFGMNESMARGAVEEALEAAVVSGRLVRGRHGSRRAESDRSRSAG